MQVSKKAVSLAKAMLALLDTLEGAVSKGNIEWAASCVDRFGHGTKNAAELRWVRIQVKGAYGYGENPNGCYCTFLEDS